MNRSIILPLLMLVGLSAGAVNQALQHQMLSHVEKIVVVDTLTVDKADFFKAYRLHPSAGRILSAAEVKEHMGNKASFPADSLLDVTPTGFTNEFNDYMLWSQPDSAGYMRLMESVRLIDGTWSQPTVASAVLNSGDEDDEEVEYDAAFPFMLDDGQTLYFASDNENSLGGFDIFVAMKDPYDGGYLQPRNLGMPFNSEYDDYMMAIDQQTGAGWWVSDRNRLDGQLTVYIFAMSDDRENVDPADEDLLSYATLSGWQDLLSEEDEELRNEIKAEIAAIRPVTVDAAQFHLPVPGKGVYTTFRDFKSSKAAALMKDYLEDLREVEEDERELADLRRNYYLSGKDKRMVQELREAENLLRENREILQNQLNEIYRLETQK